ncbi:TolA protein [Candidatus Burkholderia crenata]|nr:TolA protein [Candidatus Burkholderia crenata]
MINRQSSSQHGARVSARPVRSPRERGTWKAFALAALMHLLLGILLYHGVNWQNNTPAGAEAELWTEIPDQAAPTPRPVPPHAPPIKVQPAPPPAKDEEADTALQEKERKKQEAAARAAQLAEQQRAQQAALAAQKAAQDKQKQLAQQKLDQQKTQQVKEKEADAAKAAKQQKEAETKAQEQADAKAKAQAAKAKAKAQADAQAKAKLDKERSARLAALQGQAGGGTSESGEGLAKSGTGRGAGGTATSAGYAEKVQRRVRPNIRWGGKTAGLETVISVRVSPATGTLLSASIQRSSGNDQWDQAALRAVQLSDPMPLNINGQAPPTFTITMRPAGG